MHIGGSLAVNLIPYWLRRRVAVLTLQFAVLTFAVTECILAAPICILGLSSYC